MKVRQSGRVFLGVFMLSLVTACGGGGGGSASTNTGGGAGGGGTTATAGIETPAQVSVVSTNN